QCFQIENFGLNTKNTPNSKFSAFSLKSFFLYATQQSGYLTKNCHNIADIIDGILDILTKTFLFSFCMFPSGRELQFTSKFIAID
ncbi:MAG: hypothetical protein KAR64_10425, partial [Thermoplasmatales archaeon]|nr:hypothetical protein [Thermoplasmatales archaeon]